MKSVCFLAFVIGYAASLDISHLRSEFEVWKTKFDRVYGTKEEEVYRFKVYLENDALINKRNAEQSDYVLAHNQFSDMTGDEFLIHVHGHKESCFKGLETDDWEVVNPGMDMLPEDIPASWDWTQQTPSVVNPIKDQGNCGSCWAFSAAGCVESQYAINKGTLNSLSEQELVDCSSGLDSGCNGGFMDNAFQYINDNSGLALESQYTYTARNGQCKASQYTHYDPINEFVVVERDNSTALQAAVYAGPVSVGIEADQAAFQFYSSGVLTGNCGTNIDHGVIVVGYGHDSTSGYDYWKVRNSWGTSWGEQGYVRICRNCNKNGDKGECCILCQPSFARVMSA